MQAGTRVAVVQTEAGSVRGVQDGRSWCWLGVPYAAAPTGARRFRPPVPPTPWRGIRDGARFGPVAPQPVAWPRRLGPAVATQAEDCLSLNIWSPMVGERLRAVLVWVHGGGFVVGSGMGYGGAPLAAGGDIVVVTLNYRLGPLGFVDFATALGDPTIGRNLGLQDIAAALGWVGRNIGCFGGDPGRVTLAGHAAGAAAVAQLLRTPAANLFRSAILQGGPGDAVQTADTAARVADHHLARLRPRPRSLADLQALPLGSFGRAQAAAARTLRGVAAAAPVLDTTGHPATFADRGADGSRMPLMVGLTGEPGATLRQRSGRRATRPDASDVTDWRSIAARHAAEEAPVWAYRFDYPHPVVGTRPDLPLLFLWPFPGIGPALARGGFLTGLRSGLSERLRAAWTRFVRDGTPGEDWPAYLPERRIRVFDLQDRVVSDETGRISSA